MRLKKIVTLYCELFNFFPGKCYHDENLERKMHRYSWLVDHSSALLALVSGTILLFAWPMENVPACVVAAVMLVVAAVITIRAHFHSAGYGQ